MGYFERRSCELRIEARARRVWIKVVGMEGGESMYIGRQDWCMNE